eukprot:CAMPEP_0182561736 /NCGR_PEP_ID=MMETSP1324-20130603/4172_1 /TAXON_ID=236786 /ORGANISM="Florenciella sp., Strain RCC1587" /LENGTH=52 /DNA_ID=CAMNT_0024774445 /DNA_START=207 /DNA_END=362 /DNA_ORIENTATION=-
MFNGSALNMGGKAPSSHSNLAPPGPSLNQEHKTAVFFLLRARRRDVRPLSRV